MNTFHQLGSALGLGVLVAVAATAGHRSGGDMLAAHVQAALTAGSFLLAACLLAVLGLIRPARPHTAGRRVPAPHSPAPHTVRVSTLTGSAGNARRPRACESRGIQ